MGQELQGGRQRAFGESIQRTIRATDGIYNPDTTVEGNNFTAVGYFISTHITEEYIQVQVVNVSSGEFEGNVTVNL